MEEKYKLIKEKYVEGRTFYRLVALKDFVLFNGVEIHVGDSGGLVTEEIPQDDLSWVGVDATSIDSDISGGAYITGASILYKAKLKGKALIESSLVSGQITGNNIHVEHSNISGIVSGNDIGIKASDVFTKGKILGIHCQITNSELRGTVRGDDVELNNAIIKENIIVPSRAFWGGETSQAPEKLYISEQCEDPYGRKAPRNCRLTMYRNNNKIYYTIFDYKDAPRAVDLKKMVEGIKDAAKRQMWIQIYNDANSALG